MSAAVSMPSVFELPESSVQLNVRVPKSLKAELDRIVKHWNAHAKNLGAEGEIDMAHVVRTLLKRQVDEELKHFESKA